MAAQYPEPSRQSLDLTTNGRANPAKSNNPPSDAGSKKGLVPTHAPHQHHLLTQRSIVLEESSTSTSISSEAPDDESFAFGIEKGFWRVEHGARELLRFAELFRKHRKAMADEERSSIALLPKGIDVISMTQLSYSILHAVSDINVHSQKALHDRGPLSSSHVNRVSKSRAKRSRKRKTPSSLQQTTQTTEITCEECFCTNTPQWRNDAAGRTLCNFCGLIYAKRCQMYGSE